MSLQVEKLEKNMAKLTIEVSADEFSRHWKMLTRKTKAKSPYPVSVRARFPRR